MSSPIPLILWLHCLSLTALLGLAQTASAVPWAEARALHLRGSFALAIESYEQLIGEEAALYALEEYQLQQLRFWKADAAWRNLASTNQRDLHVYQAPRQAMELLLEELAEDKQRPPSLWAEIHTSLGDLHFRLNLTDRGDYHYREAMNWWAGSADIEEARERFMDIAMRWIAPQRGSRNAQSIRTELNIGVLNDALKLVVTPDERGVISYALARNLQQQAYNSATQAMLIPEVYEQALANLPESNRYYNNMLLDYAGWCKQAGHLTFDEEGTLVREPDYERALELYRLLPDELHETKQRLMDDILKAQVSLSVQQQYRPGDPIDLSLAWRNVNNATLSIYPLDFPTDIKRFKSGKARGGWPSLVDLSGRSPVFTQTLQTDPKRPHYHVQQNLRVNTELPAGSYLVEVSSGKLRERAPLLITKMVAVTHYQGADMALYLANAETGNPLSDATVKLLLESYTGSDSTLQYQIHETATDTLGLARIHIPQALPGARSSKVSLFISHAEGSTIVPDLYLEHDGSHPEGNQEKTYIYSDKPAYRPGETVHLKAIIRQYLNGQYQIPENQQYEIHLRGPHGDMSQIETTQFSTYGTLSGKVTITEEMPLGLYHVSLINKNKRNTLEHLVTEAVFRVEEYKLPEYEVTIKLDADGPYRTGDTISGTIQADYYFGGAVADAEVALQITQQSYTHRFFDDVWQQSNRYEPGYAQTIQELNLTTDAAGQASFSFQTPEFDQQDYTYTITAHARDASRREVVANKAIRVTKQSYYVQLKTERKIVRPGESAKVKVTIEDANQEGVARQGTLIITREEWRELWLDPRGKELTGNEVRALANKPRGLFSQRHSMDDFRLIHEGYVSLPVNSLNISTNEDGLATASFVAPVTGYYKVRWLSKDTNGVPIKQETYVWASADTDLDLGYRTDGIQIVAAKTEAATGEALDIMLFSDVPGRHVLLSQFSSGLGQSEVVKMEGNAKLLRLPLQEHHAPNFWLVANSVLDYLVYQDMLELSVTRKNKELKISITPDSTTYAPGRTAQFEIAVTDAFAQAAQTELSFALFDKAVYAIQPQLRSDVFKYFFGGSRYSSLRTGTSLDSLPYYQPSSQSITRDILHTAIDEGAYAPLKARRSLGITTVSGAYGAIMDDYTTASASAESTMLNLDSTSLEEEGPLKQLAIPKLREDFRSSLIWLPSVETDIDGKATVSVPLGDSLTTWMADVVGVTKETQVGAQEITIKTRLPLIARLQAPRFFVVGDEVTLSGVLNNNTLEDLEVLVTLEVDGLELSTGSTPEQNLKLPPQSSSRVDWVVNAKQTGEAKVRIRAQSTSYADAVTQYYPVHAHGIEQLLTAAGKLDEEAHAELSFSKPVHAAGTLVADLSVTPSLAITMLDALPQLIHYPYGCTEQTMSRFLPALVVKKVLTELGLDAQAIEARLFGGIHESQIAALRVDGEHLGYESLDEVVAASLKRLAEFQHSNGAWGWWKQGRSDAFMTAYVVWGLELARQIGTDIDTVALENARNWLSKSLSDESLPQDTQVWILHALSANRTLKPSKEEANAFLKLMLERDNLNTYGRALLAVSAINFGFEDDARLLAENLHNGAILDNKNDQSTYLDLNNKLTIVTNDKQSTAHWGEDGLHWRWSEGGVEATAFALKALLLAQPDSPLIEPALNWLLKNRRGAQWADTRETAITILTLSRYLFQKAELEHGTNFSVKLNGELISEKDIDPEASFMTPARIHLPIEMLREEGNILTIERSDESTQPLYYRLSLNYFSAEEPISPAGSELFIERSYYRIHSAPTLLKGFVEKRERLKDGFEVESGDRIEVVLQIEAKNHYAYLMLEDDKPAGFEAAQLRSGQLIVARQLRAAFTELQDDEQRYTGHSQPVYQELRDRRTAFFIDELKEGLWEIRYRLRAETPGHFHALPAKVEAMYAPEARGNSSELRVRVKDIAD